MKSRAGAVANVLLIDLLGSVLWFPIWWYSTGLLRVVYGSIQALKFRVREYGLAIWVKNLFVPMYGQYDWSGRVISVLVRFVVLVFRLLSLVIETAVYVVAIFLWIVAPLAFAVLCVTSFFKL